MSSASFSPSSRGDGRSATTSRTVSHSCLTAVVATSSLDAKLRKKVRLETSTASTSSSSVVESKPRSVNMATAVSASAWRVRSFLRSRRGSGSSVVVIAASVAGAT